jgi:hemerythrin superfamily protein
MSRTPNLFTLLKTDHRTVKGLFAQLDKTTERALRTRDRLYLRLREEIRDHSRAEENVLYPRLKQEKLTEAQAFESVEEHGVVHRLLSQLDATAADTKEWTALISVLKETIEHHVEEEEGELFPKMKRAFSAAELKDLGEQFARAKLGFFERLADMVAA